MAAASTTAADAVTAAINAAVVAGTLSPYFTAERAYVPQFVLENSAPSGLQVFVSPTTHLLDRGNRATRRNPQHTCGVVVSVIQKISDMLNETIDVLVQLVEHLKALLEGTLTVGSEIARVTLAGDLEPLYRPELLTDQRTFWGMFTLTLSFPGEVV